MADETNKEILEETQTEGTTEITPETPSEGTTEGTQTEGTAGNGYLTKPYLVRNLQTFWGKIKQYITSSISGFVNQDTVNGAIALAVSDRAAKEDLTSLETEVNSLASTVATKASQDALTSLTNIVNGKAEQSKFEALEQLVESKADKSALDDKVNKDGDKVLSTHDFETKYKDQLDNLELATETKNGLMSYDDKQKLDELVEKAVTEVDEALSETSTNPVQNKIINEALNGKVDKENPEDPSELIRLNNITSYATDEGHIVLNFIRDTEHLRIYTPNSDRPVEKVSLKDQNEILFTNFQKNDDDTLAITIENPEGKKDENSWNINSNIPFNFYIESLIVDNKKYKPFILQAVRPDEYNLSKVQLSIAKIFES